MRKNEKEQKRTMQGKSIMMGISTLALLISNSMVAFASSGQLRPEWSKLDVGSDLLGSVGGIYRRSSCDGGEKEHDRCSHDYYCWSSCLLLY